ncbi:MAG TPA: 23S rRNA (guanosine(2251)-2'-O)-methyltransferase RlmB [Streptosporangiaceae bacterium]|nr:23S rRNA (guanosine(2251)-2'-O)-methyltransferase RlmB [Streptosporangiaceae bacterium]
MSGQGRKAGPGSRSKAGKPRPGTGGYGRRKLEGKGPTPPAEMRPGHPAQRRAAAAASARGTSRSRPAAVTGAGRNASSNRGTGSATEVVAGRNAVLESLRAAVPALALHVGPRLDADDRISEAIKLAADTGVPVVEAGRAELDRLTGGAVHQGLALRIRPYVYAHPGELLGRSRAGAAHGAQPPLIVALDGITDPRNLGAVARSVAAFGATGVLVPARRSAGVTAGAWKASAGALARVRVAQAPNLSRALATYAEAGLFVVGLDADAEQDVSSMTLADGPLVLVIGSEGRGLSRLVAQQCDLVVRIPISGAESLNAGVAAGIALYEVSRQRVRGGAGAAELA